jgi:iron-sulfur cluster repair protein YtfE (RIC family)
MIQDVTSMAKQGIDANELDSLTKDGAMEGALDKLKAEDLESLLKELQTLFPSIQEEVKKQKEEHAVKKS